MPKWIRNHWFLVSLVVLFVVGTWQWPAFLPLVELKPLRNGIVAFSLFLMSLPLPGSEILRSIRRPWATMLALFVSFGVIPILALGMQLTLSHELGMGLFVAAVTPCTMASATVWTRKAGGNDAVATVVTVVTNLACFFVTPLWISGAMGQSVQNLEPPLETAKKLFLTVVLPVLIAQVLRQFAMVAKWAFEQRSNLSFASQCLILSMVLFGAAQTGYQLSKERLAFYAIQIGWMMFLVLLVHVLGFAAGLGLARLFRLERRDGIAVAFAGSQKTLMVGMQLSMAFGASVLPMVTYHAGQLFIDTLLADWIKNQQKDNQS